MKLWIKIVLCLVGGVAVLGLALALWPLAQSADCKFLGATVGKNTVGKLGALRTSLEIFYRDRERFPDDLSTLTMGGKYLMNLPAAKTCHHEASSTVQKLTSDEYATGEFGDTGGWAYVVSGSSAGMIVVDCTHTDTLGKEWASY